MKNAPGAPSERAGALGKNIAAVIALPAAPRPAPPAGLVWSTPEPLAGELTSTAGGRELPRRARSNVENALHRRRSLYNTTRF